MSDWYDNFHQILEAAIFAAAEPVSIDRLAQLFDAQNRPSNKAIREALAEIETFYHTRGVALVEVSSGYRFQAKSDYAPWLQRLWEKKPPRYSRALLETLALVAYRQPITRGEIEEVRGVAVSTNIMKTLQERGWIKVVGHKDVPGKPALFATTKAFLDYFNLKSLSELPPLEALADLDELGEKLGKQMNLAVESESDANGGFLTAVELQSELENESDFESVSVTELASLEIDRDESEEIETNLAEADTEAMNDLSSKNELEKPHTNLKKES